MWINEKLKSTINWSLSKLREKNVRRKIVILGVKSRSWVNIIKDDRKFREIINRNWKTEEGIGKKLLKTKWESLRWNKRLGEAARSGEIIIKRSFFIINN